MTGADDGELRTFLLREAGASPLAVRDWIREVAESSSVDVGALYDAVLSGDKERYVEVFEKEVLAKTRLGEAPGEVKVEVGLELYRLLTSFRRAGGSGGASISETRMQSSKLVDAGNGAIANSKEVRNPGVSQQAGVPSIEGVRESLTRGISLGDLAEGIKRVLAPYIDDPLVAERHARILANAVGSRDFTSKFEITRLAIVSSLRDKGITDQELVEEAVEGVKRSILDLTNRISAGLPRRHLSLSR